jgi:hypothetical protein
VSERISFAQTMLAAIYASPVMALPLMIAAKGPQNVTLRGQIGPFLLCIFLLWLPTVFSNLVARGLVGWLSSGLSPAMFHVLVGIVAGGLLIWVVNRVAVGTVHMGGGPLGSRVQVALVFAAACNAAMIYAVWHFGWKSNYD